MSDWTWVILGYAVAYGTLAGYGVVLIRRRARLRQRAGRLR